MFKIEIKNLQDVVTNVAKFETQELCLAWLNKNKVTGTFGKLEREVKEIIDGVLENNEDIAKSISNREVEIAGNVVKVHTLPQEFSHTITNITDQHLAEQESKEALAYLVSTDWMVVRKAETGVDFPQEIKDLRAAARLKVL